ncbi:MAG: Undecaprenyl-diphosphatase [Acidimicrobiales bacterium]|nr:Undecaprenyl-diphosphatase [Acidimicrobiales bacterium]
MTTLVEPPAPLAPPALFDAVTIDEPPRPRYVRRPEDLLRLVIGLVLLAFGTGFALLFQDAVLTFERDFFTALGGVSAHTRHDVSEVMRIALDLVFWGAVLILLIRKQFRLAGYLLLANILGGLVATGATNLLETLEPASFARLATQSDLGRWAINDKDFLGAAMAVITVMAAITGPAWRRVAFIAFPVIVLARLSSSTVLPATAFFETALGWVVGSTILLLLKAPNPRPTGDAIVAALERAGYELRSLQVPQVDARGSAPYFATTSSGQRLFVKVMGAGERSADLLFRVYRRARYRDIGDREPFASLRRKAEHEAFLTLAARDAGVQTPHLLTIAEVPARSSAELLAYDRIDGRSLDSVDSEEVDDRILRRIWEQVRVMRQRRIAHRDLRLANVLLDDDGQVWIIDWGFSEIAVEDYVLADDVAGLLASTALVVGPQLAVASAVDILGPEPLAAALPRMQPDTFSGSTRHELAHRKPLLKELRATAQEAAGVDEVKLERLKRISPATMLTFVALAGAVYFLYPQLANVDDVFARIQHASPGWMAVAVVASVVTYIGATISMAGAIPRQLRLLPTFAAQLASSFTNRITPASAGGYAVNIRFLQKSGVETPVALTGVGLNSLSGFIIHMVLLFAFLLWAGADGLSAFHLPSGTVFIYITGVTLVGIAVFTVLPPGRHLLVGKIWPAMKKAWAGLVELAHQPTKLLLLFGGGTVVTMSYMVALAASVEAFGGGISFPQLGVTYLAASTVAGAAPTPGGLGAAEAAYAAGLGLAGLNEGTALSAVFLFRFCTFWMPILPGWLAYRWLRKHGEV